MISFSPIPYIHMPTGLKPILPFSCWKRRYEKKGTVQKQKMLSSENPDKL